MKIGICHAARSRVNSSTTPHKCRRRRQANVASLNGLHDVKSESQLVAGGPIITYKTKGGTEISRSCRQDMKLCGEVSILKAQWLTTVAPLLNWDMSPPTHFLRRCADQLSIFLPASWRASAVATASKMGKRPRFFFLNIEPGQFVVLSTTCHDQT